MELVEFDGRDGSAPGQALGDRGFEVMEVTVVEDGCFAGLDWSEDRQSVGPEGCVEGGGGGVVCLEKGLPEMQCGEDVGVAVV